MASAHNSSGKLLHPFAEPAKAESEFINVVSAEGSTFTDDTGKTYIDGMASLWYCQVGHGRREIIDAITAQLNTLDAYNIFDPFTNGPARAVSELILEKSPFDDGRVFLGCSGSEAVDTALKIARIVQQRRGTTDKQIIVRRTHGYHGTNFGGTTAQGIAANREGWGDLVPHFVEVPNDNIEEMAKVFADHGERIAAVISEPVQGAGGVWPPPEGYLEGVRRLCDQHQALLIADEVICGFGRTGSWFGSQTFGVMPDLITFAKGVSSGYQPLSGVIVNQPLVEELSEPGFLLRTGYTYSGHPAACAAGIANINIIESEGLVERAKHIGHRTVEGFDALVADGTIKGYRGIGGVWAADIGRDSTPVKFDMLDRGVMARGVGEAIVWCPPLVITDDQIATFIEVLDASLR
ncbi:MAG: aminotransferase class III-fold pyridoxal phosphate-dependent enzyme [Acidimicrobiia bacterium]|nr:aminotransferase class III-fold pyridoxal phosphate-dependent enzyme [Acidimicrobiia bacterium]